MNPSCPAPAVRRTTQRCAHSIRALVARRCDGVANRRPVRIGRSELSGEAAGSTARVKLLVALVAGVAATITSAVWGAGRGAPLLGWDVLALVWTTWVWLTTWRLDGDGTARHSQRENPGRDLTDLILLAASVASLLAVGAVLFGAGSASGDQKYIRAAFALASVFISWTLVHTVFALKYAQLFNSGQGGGIDFNQDSAPAYSDFAYLAFTIGMTFQVSDTAIGRSDIRRTALRQALFSYPLGAVVIAASINLVSGLAK